MKTARITLAAALVTLAVSAAANASGFVWASTTGPGSGPPAGPLVLDCDTTPGGGPAVRCEWLITIFYQTDGYGGGGWSLDLYEDPGQIDKVHVKNYDYVETAANDPNDPNNNAFPDSVNANGFLIQSLGSVTFQPTGPGVWPLATILLSKNKLPGDTNIYSIGFGVGFNEFGGDDGGGYEVVALGPNAPRPGFYIGAPEPNPGIVIRNTPEPSTLALLGLGVVGLIRRRR